MILLVFACAGPGEPDPSESEGGPVCAGQAGGRVGECPGDFTLPTAGGGAFTLSDHAGEVVVVHLADGNAVDEGASRFLQVELEDRPELVAVDVLTGAPAVAADAAAWRDGLGLSFPVAWDEGGTFGADWGRTSLFPTLLVLDGTARVTARIHEQYETQLPAALDGR